jgi:bacterioferritin
MSKEDREARKKNVIEVLNKARAMELQAIHQYMNQHYNLGDMDYGELAVKLKLIATDEMRHSEQFADRIKELGGEPTADPTGPIEKRQKVETVFTFEDRKSVV